MHNPYNQPPTTLGKILHAVYGIDNRPYDTIEVLWAKVARSLGVNVSPDDDLESVLARIETAGGAPASAQSFSTTPSNLDPTPQVGLFAGFQHSPTLVGVTSITVHHTTNTEGYDFNSANDVESFTFPNLETLTDQAYIYIDAFPKLTIVSAPKLTTTDGDINVSDNDLLTSLLFPVLESCGRFSSFNNPALATLSLPSLTSVLFGLQISNCDGLVNLSLPVFASAGSVYPTAGVLVISGNASLASLSLPALTNVNQLFQITNNPALVTWSAPGLVFTNAITTQQYDFSGNALSAASVNAILAQAVSNPAYDTGSLKLEGGTNAAPTGQGIADKATLIGRGVIVTTN